MRNESAWFTRVQQLNLPAVLPVNALPGKDAPIKDWTSLIREDPLLTIYLFRYANKMLASHDVSVLTLEHAASLLGTERLHNLSAKIPRVEETSASAKGLLRAIGDSLLAASLLRQWFQIRQIPWTEADYWVSLFYDLSIWIGWLLEPEQMENIEFRVQKGEDRGKLLQSLFNMPVREFNAMLCRYFQLPVMPNDSNEETDTQARIQPFKQSALKFFLPFSHDLAFAVRQDWQSKKLDDLCRSGEVSLGLPEFKPKLKQWVTTAAREFKLTHASIAARKLLAQQPEVSIVTQDNSGFSIHDMALAQKLSHSMLARAKTVKQPEPEPIPELQGWPEAEAIQKTVKKPSEKQKTSEPKAPQRRANVNLNVQQEIRRQFRNKRSWHSAVEIQESALYGLLHGLSLSRLVVMEEKDGYWQTFDSEGCQHQPTLRSLKLPIHASEILTELSKRATALWVNNSNQQRAGKLLPQSLMAATEKETFFLRSFSIGDKVTMLLYADGNGQEELLNELDYQLFREYCIDWNTALNKMRA